MLTFRPPSKPVRRVILTSSSYNVGRYCYVYDLDNQRSLDLIEFKEIILLNDLPLKKSLPPELGYLVLDYLIEDMLADSDYEGVMNLVTINTFYLLRFYSTYFTTPSAATPMKKLSRLSRILSRLDSFHDCLLFRDICSDGLDREDLCCIEMIIQNAEAVDKYHDPWHFRHPTIAPAPPFIIPGLPFTKIIPMGPVKINTLLMANHHYLESVSLEGGILTPNILKHPFIILALTTADPNNRVVPTLESMLVSPSWQAFVALLIKGYGPNTGLYLASSAPHIIGYSLMEFPPIPPTLNLTYRK